MLSGARLQNVTLDILPKRSVSYGSTVLLRCNHNPAAFDNKPLDSIKFYRNEKEFYKYIFGDDAPKFFNPSNLVFDFDVSYDPSHIFEISITL